VHRLERVASERDDHGIEVRVHLDQCVRARDFGHFGASGGRVLGEIVIGEFCEIEQFIPYVVVIG
jgi:hypothetical protein